MIKSVISDLGNVLIFFDNDIFIKKIVEYTPLSFDEVKKEVLAHMDLSIAFDRGEVTPAQFYDEAVRILKADINKTLFFTLYNDIFSLNPPVVDILASLRSSCRLVLCSNTDVERFGFIRVRFPETQFFDSYVLSYEAGFMKPHPKIYERAVEAAGVREEECLFIDDREENTAAAEKRGLRTVLFKPQIDLRQELLEFGLSGS